jgi:hypothetical protein
MRYLLMSILLAIPCSADIFTVDDDGPADFTSIQEALDWAWDGDMVVVMPGQYQANSIRTYGKRLTLTSATIVDPSITEDAIIDASAASYAFVFDNGEKDTQVQGFTVIGGKSAALHVRSSSPSLKICTFINTPTIFSIESNQSDYPIHFISCKFSNTKFTGGKAELSKCRFEICTVDSLNATASDTEFDLSDISNSHGVLERCNIIGKQGNPVIKSGDGSIKNCIISGGTYGIYNYFGNIINCTIIGNKGSGIFNPAWDNTRTPLIRNNIIVLNGEYGVSIKLGRATMTFNNIWGNTLGSYYDIDPSPNDIHVNPGFAADGSWSNDQWLPGDYHLKSKEGRWNPKINDWVKDSLTSRCIDAGNPVDSVGQEPNPNGGRINMGAYGGTVEASKSPSGIVVPFCQKPPKMDFTGDCKVNLADFAIFASDWLTCGIDPPTNCPQ